MRTNFVALLGAVALLAVTGCGGDSEDEAPAGGSAGTAEPATVDVGILPYSGMAALYLGQEKGFFEEQNLTLNLTPAQAPAPILAQVISGQQDIGFSTTIAQITAVAEGAKVKAVAPVDGVIHQTEPATAIMVGENSDITSVEELEGKKVAVPALKSELDLLVQVLVDRAGGDASKVQSVQVPFPEMHAALEAGRVDAIATAEPFQTLASKEGAKILVEPEQEVLPGANVTAWVASERFISENPDVVKRFVAAMKESLQYAGEHPDEARGIIPEFTELEPELVDEINLGVEYEPVINVESLERIAQLMVERGFIEEAPPVERLVHDPGA